LEGISPKIAYSWEEGSFRIDIEGAKGCRFVLPLLAGYAEAKKGSLAFKEEIFFLTGGFKAQEYSSSPTRRGDSPS